MVSDMCPDPGTPENGRRAGADFRWETITEHVIL